MTELPGDSWTAGEAYEAYMGRWSRSLARVFLDWLRPGRLGHWLDVGCGTGALTAAIVDVCEPASVIACDPSEPFIEHARKTLSGVCTFHVIPTADALPRRDLGFDVVVSGLVLNFMSQPASALRAMRERSRRGGTVAAYIWDYAGGIELLNYFWEEAVSLNATAASVDESRRFAGWDLRAMESLFCAAGFADVETAVLEIPTEFSSYEDYWKPFLGRSGPAPSYVASLDSAQRELLRARLERRLSAGEGRHVRLRARALATRGTVK